jgi:hypothetical protein
MFFILAGIGAFVVVTLFLVGLFTMIAELTSRKDDE